MMRTRAPWALAIILALTSLPADVPSVRAKHERGYWGFAVGRQPIVFQEGLLINDQIDGVAIVRDTLYPP